MRKLASKATLLHNLYRKLKRFREFSPAEICELSKILILNRKSSINFKLFALTLGLFIFRPVDFWLLSFYRILDNIYGASEDLAIFLTPFGLDMIQVLHLASRDYERACATRKLCVIREAAIKSWIKFSTARYSRKITPVFIEAYTMSSDTHSDVLATYEYHAKKAFEKSIQVSNQLVLDTVSNAFHEYIAGKSIALVGPSPVEPSKKQDKIIDSHDVVIRLNDPYYYQCSGTLGSRSNIAFFNGQKAEKFLNGPQSLSDDLRFVVFKTESQALRFRERQECSSRVITFPVNSYKSLYNMIPVVILDLLLFSPSTINLFGVNLWLNPAKIPGYQYQSDAKSDIHRLDKLSFTRLGRLSPEDRNRIIHDFIHHNPFAQFSLLKFLSSQRILGGDEHFINIISLTHMEYATKLQSVYGTDY